jgi:hypothetical protein
MKNIVSTTFYGYFNYVLALVTMASPWLFNFWHVGGAALFPPLIFGWFQLIMAIFSVNKAGFMKIFPNQFHMVLDVFAGFVILVSPFLYNFADQVWVPHVIIGGIMLLVGVLTFGSPLQNLSTSRLQEGNLGSVASNEGRLSH